MLKANITQEIRSMVECFLNDNSHIRKYNKINDYHDLEKSVVHFWFYDDYLNETVLFKKDYQLSNIEKELPLDFISNIESWVTHISRLKKERRRLCFEYSIDLYYPKVNKYYQEIGKGVGDPFAVRDSDFRKI